jgi:hypothetical protein
VLVGRAPVAQGELGLGDHAGQGGAELVRDLGRKALLVAQAGGDAVQQRIERGGQAAELVPGRTEVEPPAAIGHAPGLRLLGHTRDLPERAGDEDVSGERDHDENQDPEHRGADERRLRRAVVRAERDQGHHRSESSSARYDRDCV